MTIGIWRIKSLTLVKRRCICAIYPWICERDEAGAVEYDIWEIASVEEWPIETHVKESVQPRVDVDAAVK